MSKSRSQPSDSESQTASGSDRSVDAHSAFTALMRSPGKEIVCGLCVVSAAIGVTLGLELVSAPPVAGGLVLLVLSLLQLAVIPGLWRYRRWAFIIGVFAFGLGFILFRLEGVVTGQILTVVIIVFLLYEGERFTER